ncbi:MAG: hypothetical protein QOH25_735 [Acidobacteriota bacterium]|jgi:hypothetical protein|nr:hypothetical protein [Acidobacteriota bacterium]
MSIRKIVFSFVLLFCLTLIVAPTTSAQSPSGDQVVKTVRAQAKPIGYEALAIYMKLRSAPFQQNVQFSNRWIQSHISYYDKSRDAGYRAYVKDMIDGGGDVQLGMRSWLSDPKNVAWWDNAIRQSASDEGYARVVALNAAFAPGSNDYRLTYGGTRLYDSGKNMMSLNGTTRPGLSSDRMTLKYDPRASNDEMFGRMIKFGDTVRQKMFNFYQAYADKKVTPEQVRAFNEAYILAGGCALAGTNALEANRVQRYVHALNFMSQELTRLGF